MEPYIIGWGHTRFGRLEDKTLEDLIVEVAREAVLHAGIEFDEIDAIWLGNFNGGLVADSFASSLALGADPSLRFTPATRVENACASGAAAMFSARNAIKAGLAKTVLVIGAEKMTAQTTKGVTEALAGASYQKEEAGVSFPEIFSRFAKSYNQKYGDQSIALAHIAAKNHANATKNPLAHLQKDLGFEACNTVSDKNPLIAPPLRMTDCSLISDGAAAVILADADVAESAPNKIAFRSTVHVNDYLPMSRRDILAFEGPAKAIAQALDDAGATLGDLSFAEVHDCFTIAELLIYEAMGITPKGQGARAILDGVVHEDGALPVNLSGGLKSKGHPVGATGVSMHVMAAQQLTGTAGRMQVSSPDLGFVFNMGGSGVANYCSILENAR